MSLYNHDYNNRLRDITSGKENTVLTLAALALITASYILILELTGTADKLVEYAATFISFFI